MDFHYKAFKPDGTPTSGLVSAIDLAGAEERLWQSNLVVASIKARTDFRGNMGRVLRRNAPTLFRTPARELVGFTRELSSLLASGISLHQALGILQDRSNSASLKDAIMTMRKDIQEGSSFSEAIVKHKGVFPELYDRLISVGEETGNLSGSLDRLGTYLEKQALLARKVAGALRYPIIVMIVACIAGFLLATSTLPALASLLTEFGGQLSPQAKMLIYFTNFISDFGKILFLTFLAVIIGSIGLFRSKFGAALRDRMLLNLPLLGKLIRVSLLFRITSSLSAMISSGLPLVESVDLSRKLVPNSVIKQALLITHDDLLSGISLSQALQAHTVFPALMTQLVAVGEQSGTLAESLETVAKFFDAETDRLVTNITGLIEPGIILVVGGGIGFLAISVFTSLYGALGQIK